MAKQVINYGQEANDGTGDALRTAMIKIVSNFDELYDGQFSGEWSDLTNLPTTLIGSFGITDGANNAVLTTNGNGTLTFRTPTAAIDTDDVDAHLNTGTAANNQILSWDGTDYDWINAPSGGGSISNTEILAAVTAGDLDMGGARVLFGNVYNANTDLPNASTYHGMFAHVHTEGNAYFAHAGNWVRLALASELGGGGTLSSRVTKTTTASSLANNATANVIIDGFKGYNLYSIQTSHAAWVRLYISTAARTADSSRAQTSDPAPDAGVIAEVITAGAETVKFGPAIAGYTDDASTTIVAAITNLSGATNNVQVTLSLLQLEA